MAGGIDWYRAHHGTVADPKLGLVAQKAGQRRGDVVAMWHLLMEAASAAIERGNPGAPDFESIEFLLGMGEGGAEAIYQAMIAKQMVDPDTGRLTAWARRQPKRERDPAPAAEDAPAPRSSTERSRDHRARKAVDAPDEAMQRHATPCNASTSHATPREEESREDTSPSLRSVEGASKRAARKCPASFQVTADLEAWAADKAPGIDTAVETEKFRDYTFKNAITDWRGAWRNWLRRAFEARPASRPEAKSFAERDAEKVRGEVSAWTGGILGNAPGRPVRFPDTFDMEESNGSLIPLD